MQRLPSESPSSNRTHLWIGAVFFVLAAVFLLGSAPFELPAAAEAVAIAPSDLEIAPLRAAMTDPPKIMVGGYMQGCVECHRLFDSLPETPARLNQHENVVLRHGLNDRCLNCHSLKDRDKLALQGSEEIGYGDVVRLCAKCHGPTFRDWEKGMHGKTLGFWDETAGEVRRLICTECHDPHAPAFAGMRPLPGPNTLRMGEPRGPHHDPEKLSPLMQWMTPHEKRHD